MTTTNGYPNSLTDLRVTDLDDGMGDGREGEQVRREKEEEEE